MPFPNFGLRSLGILPLFAFRQGNKLGSRLNSLKPFLIHTEVKFERSFNRNAPVAKEGVGVDFAVFALLESRVKIDNFFPMLVVNLVSLVAQRLPHLGEEGRCVDELNLALASLFLPVRNDPDVG